MEKTLGGDRLGSGKKQKVYLHGYERSTHDMGYLWRSTMAAGTLVPFLCEVALPGDTFDINLGADIKTHPTIGPLFGSYKVQLDVFQCPIRLYQGQLHNNKLGIGMNMANVKLPTYSITTLQAPTGAIGDIDNLQINPSCLLSYLGLRGAGLNVSSNNNPSRAFNGVPLLAYWDIYKNYYANKQEEIGAVVNTPLPGINKTVTAVNVGAEILPAWPTTDPAIATSGTILKYTYTATAPNPNHVHLVESVGAPLFYKVWAFKDLVIQVEDDAVPGEISGIYDYVRHGAKNFVAWKYASADSLPPVPISVHTFPLSNLDTMRENILAHATNSAAFNINAQALEPYSLLLSANSDFIATLATQQGLALKTYQSDLFNNWLSTEWIDGPGGINEITAIDTSSGSFNIDTLNLSKKVYDMLNRIAVSGGTYDDWLDTVYDHPRFIRAESPMYMGGLIKELVFQEVVSNSASSEADEPQPLGTLAGKGVMAGKHKGGEVTIKVDEPSYIIGIVSLTPRLDYSQGNKWDVHLKTMDDFHKPALDQIGFQELITEQMAWWDTINSDGTNYIQKSAGKQPAWLNYMTNVNQVRGNFAIKSNEMFMTLNRRYEQNTPATGIKDLTTYIDPSKFNHIFAETSLDAQNFWAQIAVDMTVRRKMSAKIMPNL